MIRYSFIKYILFVFLFASYVGVNAITLGDTIRFNKKRIVDFRDKIIDAPIVIKTSPTAFIYGGIFPFTAEYRLMAEITTSRTQADQASFSVLGKSMLLQAIETASNYSTSEILKVSGWRVQYAHKFYLISRKKFAPSGFYIGPLLSYSNAHIALGLSRYYTHTYYDFRNFNANVMIGLQAAKKNRVTFEVYAAAGYKSNKLFYHATSSNIGQLDTSDYGILYNTHINATFGINMGYAF